MWATVRLNHINLTKMADEITAICCQVTLIISLTIDLPVSENPHDCQEGVTISQFPWYSFS